VNSRIITEKLSEQVSYHKFTLDNGLTVVAERHPYLRSVSVGVWVRAGSAYETAQLNGVSHFVEHMVFKGTQKRNALEIATVLESLGGELNAFTEKEVTCFYANALYEHLDVVLDVLSDIVCHPTFPKDQLERERRVLLQEHAMSEESPEERIAEEFFKTVWKDLPLGQPVLGSAKNIHAFKRQHLMNYYERMYQPQNMVLSVAGPFEVDNLYEKVEKFFQFTASKDFKVPVEKNSPYQGRYRFLEAEQEQAHLILGFEGLNMTDASKFDLLCLSLFLGGGMSSRLFQEVRENAGLAYTVDCECMMFQNSGAVGIYAAVQPKNIKECLKIFSKEVLKLTEKPLAEKDLQLIQSQLKGMLLMAADQMESRQESLGRNELYFGRYVPVEQVIERVMQVTPARMQKLAQSLFQPKKESLLILSPTKKPAKKLTIF